MPTGSPSASTEGGHFSASSLAADTDFDDAGTIGGTVSFWFHENVGVRANTLWAPTDIVALQADNVLAGEDPNVWHDSGEVLLRLPLPAGDQMTWFPYAVAGIGGKTYDFETLGTETDFTGNFGAGVELRFGDLGRWGIHTEVRDFISNFDRLGFDETLHDVVWTGGISLNF